MSDRLRNNVIAGFIVVAFWIVFVLPVMAADPIVTNSTSNSTVTTSTDAKSTIRTNPPSAISPSINASNSDLCMVGVSGAVQTQILGISTGQAYSDENCMRLKNAKVLYDMGMKVAAVSVITDLCDPDNLAPVHIEDLLENAAKAEVDLIKLFKKLALEL